MNDATQMIVAMETFGGAFAQSIAHAWRCADQGNRQRLLAAFPELVAEYGSGSLPYAALTKARRRPEAA